MQIIDTTHIERFPKDVTLGCAPISGDYSTYILSEKERSEFRNFKSPERQAEYLTARYLFRYMTEKRSIDPDKIQLDKEKGGKPFARSGENHLHVSFSHTQKMVFCAFSETMEIGVDTELLSRTIPNRVLDRVLDKEERKELKGLDPLQIWTLKESAVKCIGTGLRTNLNEVNITVDKNGKITARFNNDKFIEICSFKATDHQIALAYHSNHI